MADPKDLVDEDAEEAKAGEAEVALEALKEQARKDEDEHGDGFARIESVATSKGVRILHPMFLDFPEGSVTAILGPSGSGKTTLLDTITGNIQSSIAAVAEVYLPGANAFVPQDDRLHGFYTCSHYLEHYARLAGLAINEETRNEMIILLRSLGLQDQANTIVGDIFFKGLSGGQKRRLSIALEALTHPKNLFLDEPTSGLDAESALQVMDFLREYARGSAGRRVILTIHQPSSFVWQLVDNVILLSKGKLMYQGSRSIMESFFAYAGHPTPPSYNPADHYVTVVNDEFRNHAMEIDEWAAKFEEFIVDNNIHLRTDSMLGADDQQDLRTRRSNSPGVIMELTYRYFLNLWFNPGILGTRVVMYCMLALGVGALFYDLGDQTDTDSVQSRAAVLFYCVAFFIFMSVAVLPFTLIERAIVDKEVANGYYNPIYYQMAQGISSIPGAALLSLVTTVIIISLTKLSDPLWYFLDMFLSLFCAEALAQLVSHMVPHFVIGMAICAGMYGFFMLFQGFMLPPSDFPNWLRWAYNVPFHTYAWRTFMFSEFGGDDVVFDSEWFPTGLSVLEYYEIEDVNRGHDMVVLVCYGIIIHLVSFAVLHCKYSLLKGKVTPLPKKTM